MTCKQCDNPNLKGIHTCVRYENRYIVSWSGDFHKTREEAIAYATSLVYSDPRLGAALIGRVEIIVRPPTGPAEVVEVG